MQAGFARSVGLLALFAASSAVSAQEVFVAKLTSPKGLGLKKTAELTLTLSGRTTDEELATLRKALQEQGSKAFFDALRKLDHGVAKVTGGPSSPISFFRTYPGQNGASVVILTAKPLYFPEDGAPSAQSSVGVVRLEVNTAGQGRGTLAEALELRITDEGTFEVQAATAAPIDLEEVVRKP